MSVQYVTVKGEKLPISFNVRTLLGFTKASGVGLDSLDNLMGQDPEVLEELFYQGLKEGHRLEGKELEIEKKDVLAVGLEEFEGYTKALEAGLSSTPVKKKKGQTKQAAPTKKNRRRKLVKKKKRF
jgi:hypothetical protein